jgi:hypothetical protein
MGIAPRADETPLPIPPLDIIVISMIIGKTSVTPARASGLLSVELRCQHTVSRGDGRRFQNLQVREEFDRECKETP